MPSTANSLTLMRSLKNSPWWKKATSNGSRAARHSACCVGRQAIAKHDFATYSTARAGSGARLFYAQECPKLSRPAFVERGGHALLPPPSDARSIHESKRIVVYTTHENPYS